MATRTETAPAQAAGPTRLPRTTGALSGLLIVVLGLWGALIPFVGPYFHYAFGSYHTWHYSVSRLWLDIIPGAVAVLGGIMLLRGASRLTGLIGGWLAVAAGAWFAVGPTVYLLWHHATNPIGAPMGGYTRQALEQLGYFYALGAAIIGLAAFAMGRYFSRPRVVDEAAVVAAGTAAAGTAAAGAGAAREERRVAEREEGPAAAGAAPVAARDEPVAARDEPVATREEPVAARQGEPIAAREDEPVPTRSEPVAAREEPVAARGEPVAGREDAAVTARDEPVTASEQPVAARDEPLAAPNEVAAPQTPNEVAGPQNEVAGPQSDAATAGAGTPGTATSSRRRPGLLRRWVGRS